MKQKLVLGADPEMFATYGNGKYAAPPAYLISDLGVKVESNGNHPKFLNDNRGGFVHADGAAMEISVPPSTDWEVIWEQCNAMIKRVENEILSNYPNDVDPKLSTVPTIEWEVSRWKWKGAEFDYATRFGCDKDYDAWKEFAPPLAFDVMDASQHPERYAGGHIHFSIPGSTIFKDNPLGAIGSLVYTAGLAAIAFSPNPDLEAKRAIRYGKPSKYRVQNYSNGDVGIEYRTPSASWLGDKSLAERVFYWGRIGINVLLLEGALEKMKDMRDAAAAAIMNADQKQAVSLLAEVERRL